MLHEDGRPSGHGSNPHSDHLIMASRSDRPLRSDVQHHSHNSYGYLLRGFTLQQFAIETHAVPDGTTAEPPNGDDWAVRIGNDNTDSS